MEAEQTSRTAAAAVLRALVTRQALAEAETWLADWRAHQNLGHDLLARAMLCEDAADGTAENQAAAARWLYQKALDYYMAYALPAAQGEAAQRARHARRVDKKLARLVAGEPAARIPWRGRFPNEADPEADPSEADPNQADPNQADPAEANPDEAKLGGAQPDEGQPDEGQPDEGQPDGASLHDASRGRFVIR